MNFNVKLTLIQVAMVGVAGEEISYFLSFCTCDKLQCNSLDSPVCASRRSLCCPCSNDDCT
jgi:hypothetical protein